MLFAIFAFLSSIPFFVSSLVLPETSSIFFNRDRPFTITIEGNVGAGKSTLMGYFHKYPDMALYTEPLPIWQNLSGTNFLELAYQDPSRWGMSFESLVTLTMTEIHLADQRKEGVRFKPIKVMERSIHSARNCFMETLKPTMTEGEMEVLDQWYKLLTTWPQFNTNVDLIVYLRTSPEVALERRDFQ